MDKVRLQNGADSGRPCSHELRKMRRLGSRVKEGRLPGMAASEAGMGVGGRRGAEAKTKVYTVFLKQARKAGCAWGKKSHHRRQEKMSFAKAKSPVFMGNRKWGVWAGVSTASQALREGLRCRGSLKLDSRREGAWG